MEQQVPSLSNQVSVDDNSSGWLCIACTWIWRPSDRGPSASTTEDLTQSSTDPIDTSSLKEDTDMGGLNPEQQTPAQVSDAGKSGTWTCLKKCFTCDKASRDSIKTDEITESSTDPTDFSTSSMKEGIEMDNLRGQPSVSGLQRVLADGKDSGDLNEDSVKNVETANLQQGESSKQETDGTNASSPVLSLETEV